MRRMLEKREMREEGAGHLLMLPRGTRSARRRIAKFEGGDGEDTEYRAEFDNVLRNNWPNWNDGTYTAHCSL